MSDPLFQPDPVPSPDGPTVAPLSAAGPQRIRAYCGDAHHHECVVAGEDPPQYLDLPVATGTRRYRLVRHPRTGAPARDPGGALVFVPAGNDCGPEPPM